MIFRSDLIDNIALQAFGFVGLTIWRFMFDIEQSELQEILYYDATSKTGLRWKKTLYTGNPKRVLVKAGDEAGSKAGNRYEIGFNNQGDLTHRIVWQLNNGKIPDGLQIDHKDGNGLNNNLSNLRCVTQIINLRNTKMRSHNTTGFTGVALTKKVLPTKTYTYYTALWRTIEGRQQRANFSIEKLGEQTAFLLAFSTRQGAMEDLHYQGAGYSDRHGL